MPTRWDLRPVVSRAVGRYHLGLRRTVPLDGAHLTGRLAVRVGAEDEPHPHTDAATLLHWASVQRFWLCAGNLFDYRRTPSHPFALRRLDALPARNDLSGDYIAPGPDGRDRVSAQALYGASAIFVQSAEYRPRRARTVRDGQYEAELRFTAHWPNARLRQPGALPAGA